MPLVELPPAVNAPRPAFLGYESCYGSAMLRSKACLSLFALVPLAACAADTTNYPSLAKREAERIANATIPPPALPPQGPVADPGLDSRLAGLVAKAEAAHEKFLARRGKAETLVGAAGGAAMGSESWAVASVALADLQSARSETMLVLADLDELWVAARVDGAPAQAIETARNRVSTLVGEEDRVVAGLNERLAV